jgi:sugar-specific transcriptional regulator TrmB
MPIEQALEQWGLSPKEIKVYLAGLELGAVPVQDLAKKTGIERTNVYSIVEGLIHQGLFTETEKAGKKYFVAESPEKLVLKLKDREKEIESVLPELKSIYNLSPQKPRVRFYEGAEGIKTVMEDVLATGENYVACWSVIDKTRIIGEQYSNNYIDQRVKKKIFARLILDRNPKTERWQKEGKEYLREVKFMPKEFSFSSNIYIYGDKVALFSLKKDILAIIIENKEISEFLKIFLNFMWERI